MKHYGDITKLSGYTLPTVDVICGGSPCQDLSLAGKRAGLAGERSGLFMEQIRIIREMREKDGSTGRSGFMVRPRFGIWENVPGAFSSNGGADFQAVLTEFVRIAEPEAPDVPMPEGGRWPKSGIILGNGFSVSWRLHDAQFWGVSQRRKRIALVADFGGHSAPEILFEREGLRGNPAESFEAWERTARDPSACVGTEGVICLNDQGGERMDVSEDVAGTLRAEDHGHPPVVLALEYHPADGRIGIAADNIVQTLTQRMGTGGGNVPLVMDVGFFQAYEDKEGTLLARQYKDPPIMVQRRFSEDDNIAIVRRLTPLECERLQGFPDFWTDIGDWIDSKGKKHKGDSDAPRYKALGNSISLPFWQYLARRICAQYERDITIGSLFDGIGGFPLVFERCGAKAVWASEIEEFPIAVTKKHFPEPEKGAER